LGNVRAISGPSWDIYDHFERFWGFVATTVEQSWPNLLHLGAILGFLASLVLVGPVLSHLGTILNPKPKMNNGFTLLIVFNLQRSSFKKLQDRFGAI